jgi:5-methylcytosine-specific restriction endonuclease McrA
VIRLRDRSAAGSDVHGVHVGIDPGSKHTGISVFAEHGGARSGKYAIQLDHRSGLIRDKLTARAAYRRGRRGRNLRYRAPRFSNRIRPKGWLAPSLAHRVDTTMSIVRRLRRWAPVRAIHVERVSFDTHAMSAGRSLAGAEYQQGTLAGYEVRQYLLERWGRSCAYCGTGNTQLQVEHIHPKARGGSDRIANLSLACKPCNQAKGAIPVEKFLAKAPAKLARILSQAKAPLWDAAAVNATSGALWRTLKATGVAVYPASGGRTKWNRSLTGSPKSHTLDALHVGNLDTVAVVPKQVLVIKSTGRGSYARTRTNRYGFVRLRLPRVKIHHGYATGDLVRAVVPQGKHQGTHTGRVAVRSSGSHTVQTEMGPIKTSWKNLRLLQRGDGYTYHRQGEACRL